MGIGINTLKRAFDEIWANEHLTRKELAKRLGTSDVSAGRAVDALVGAGLLSLAKGNEGGRISDIVSVSKDKLCLLIDLCGRSVSFAVTSPTREAASVRSLPFLHMRDIDANLSIALSDIVRYMNINSISPDVIAVAVPNTVGSPEPEFYNDALKACGLRADIVISGAEAACKHFDKLSDSFAFLSIDPIIWGFSSAEPSRMLDWGKIKVGAHHGESFAGVLSYDTDPDHLKIYLRRILTSINTVLAPERLFVSSSFLPEAVMNTINEITNAENVSDCTPVISGLLCFAKDKLFEKFILIS
jgi:hypothetical protein